MLSEQSTAQSIPSCMDFLGFSFGPLVQKGASTGLAEQQSKSFDKTAQFRLVSINETTSEGRDQAGDDVLRAREQCNALVARRKRGSQRSEDGCHEQVQEDRRT